MGFFTGISNKFISGYADAFFVYCSVPVCFLYSSTGSYGAGKAYILCSCEPVAAMAFGFFFFREIPTVLSIAGLIIVLIALAMLVLSDKKQEVVEE